MPNLNIKHIFIGVFPFVPILAAFSHKVPKGANKSSKNAVGFLTKDAEFKSVEKFFKKFTQNVLHDKNFDDQ
jgi:hypothetical protein